MSNRDMNYAELRARLRYEQVRWGWADKDALSAAIDVSDLLAELSACKARRTLLDYREHGVSVEVPAGLWARVTAFAPEAAAPSTGADR